MDKDSNSKRCNTCGGSISEGEGPGTITQWMFICNCQAKLLADSGSIDDIEVCSKCGKTKKTNRAGTLTQWIFKPDFCNCDEELFANSSDLISNIKKSQSIQSTVTQEPIEENYIEVSSSVIPSDRYKVIEIKGKGGTGTVYKCRDVSLNKLVAVKSLNMHTPEQVMAFQMEAKALSRLNHPNIIKVIDFGITQEQSPYMVMQLFDGYSLDDHLKKFGPLPSESAIDLFIAICNGIQHAHQSDIFHRDLKPTNILISISKSTISKVMIIDFGVATLSKIKSPEDSQGRTLVGTPAYMSPDQADGKIYDARSEIYSIGVMLFECLTGTVPFLGDTSLDTINQHATKEPPLLSERNTSSSFSNELEEIVAKCLSKSPAQRFQSIEELRKALFEASHVVSGEATVPTTTETKKSNSWLHPRLLVSLTAILILGLSVFAYFAWIKPSENSSINKKENIEKHYPLLAEESPVKEPKFTKSKSHNFIAFNAADYVTNDDVIDLANREVIQGLDIAGSNVTGSVLKELRKEPIIYINFSALNLNDEAFKDLERLTSLRILRFEHVPLNDKRVDSICTLKNLRVLDLENTRLTDSQLKKISNLKFLQDLDIQTNPSIKDKTFLSLSKCKFLKSVYLSDTSITKDTLRKLLKMNRTIKSVWILKSDYISQKDLSGFSKKFPYCKFQGQPLINELGSAMYDDRTEKVGN